MGSPVLKNENHKKGNKMHKQEIEKIIFNVERELKAGLLIKATDQICFEVDKLLSRGDYVAAAHLIDQITPEKFPPAILTGVLMVSRPPRIIAAAFVVAVARGALSKRCFEYLNAQEKNINSLRDRIKTLG